MKSLEEGITPVRAFRIPDELWSRLTAWASASGVGDSEALRALLRLGLETPPAIPVRPPIATMRGYRVPDGHGIVCRITDGSDWWDLDEVMAQVPGAKRVLGARMRLTKWRSMPADQAATVRELFAGRASRVRMHTLSNQDLS